jgi:hypothetical protein
LGSLQTGGTFRAWARFAILVGAFALACDVAAALTGSELRYGFATLGFLAGLCAFGAACVARAYWKAGDGNVGRGKRLALAFGAPGALMVVLLIAAAILEWARQERIWLWIVGPPLLLAAERVSVGLLPPRGR